jgi:hypothetical protein
MNMPTLEEAQANLVTARASAESARARLRDVEAQIADGAGISGADYQAALGDVAVAEGAIAGAEAAVHAAQSAESAQRSRQFAEDVLAWHGPASQELEENYEAAAAALTDFAELSRAHNAQLMIFSRQAGALEKLPGVIEDQPFNLNEPIYRGRAVPMVDAAELIAALTSGVIEATTDDYPRQLVQSLRAFGAGARPIGK